LIFENDSEVEIHLYRDISKIYHITLKISKS